MVPLIVPVEVLIKFTNPLGPVTVLKLALQGIVPALVIIIVWQAVAVQLPMEVVFELILRHTTCGPFVVKVCVMIEDPNAGPLPKFQK